MVQKILSKLFGTHHDREMKKIQPTVDKINALEESIKKLSDDQLKQKTVEFQNRLEKGETVFDIYPKPLRFAVKPQFVR
jgi:preprotein translocase subunit SecA